MNLHLNYVLMLNWIAWNRTIFIKIDLALNNIKRLIWHKTQPTLLETILHVPGLICLHIVKWFQALLSNINSFIFTQFHGFQHNKWVNSSIWLPFRVRVDLEVIAMKAYSTFPKAAGLNSHHQIVCCHFQDNCLRERVFADMQSAYFAADGAVFEFSPTKRQLILDCEKVNYYFS